MMAIERTKSTAYAAIGENHLAPASFQVRHAFVSNLLLKAERKTNLWNKRGAGKILLCAKDLFYLCARIFGIIQMLSTYMLHQELDVSNFAYILVSRTYSCSLLSLNIISVNFGLCFAKDKKQYKLHVFL